MITVEEILRENGKSVNPSPLCAAGRIPLTESPFKHVCQSPDHELDETTAAAFSQDLQTHAITRGVPSDNCIGCEDNINGSDHKIFSTVTRIEKVGRDKKSLADN